MDKKTDFLGIGMNVKIEHGRKMGQLIEFKGRVDKVIKFLNAETVLLKKVGYIKGSDEEEDGMDEYVFRRGKLVKC